MSEIYIWGSERANFTVDITDVIDTKVAALRAHTSQFTEEFIQMILERWKDGEGGTSSRSGACRWRSEDWQRGVGA